MKFFNLSKCIRFFKYTIRKFNGDKCLLRASALTFTSILALIPITILIFIVFRAFGGLETLQVRFEQFLFSHLLPESVMSIRKYIQTLVYGFNSKTVSVISIFFLLILAYSLFKSIDDSMNMIWRAQKQRSILSRFVHLWFVLTVSPLFLGYSIYLSTMLLDQKLMNQAIVVWFVKIFLYFLPTLLSWFTLALVYKYFPKTSVSFPAALIGGFIAAVLWEFSKFGFNVYVRTFANFKMLYGSFMILPLFLVWIHLTWLIVLGGAETAYVVQHFAALDLDEKHGNGNNANLHAMIALVILSNIATRFRSGLPPISDTEIAENCGCSQSELDPYLNLLCEHGLILRTESAGSVGKYTIGKDPENIFIADVIDKFDIPESRITDKGVQSLWKKLRNHRRRCLTEISLADLTHSESDKETSSC